MPQQQFLHTGSSSHTSAISEIDLTLQSHSISISSFTSQLDTCRKKLNPYDYSDAVCIRLHRLLDYAPLDPSARQKIKPLDNVVHLSLVAVMTTLMPEYGHNSARYFLLANELREALQVAEGNDEVMLWAMLVAYVTILSKSEHVWILPLVREVCARLCVRCWEDVRKVLCRYAWIGVLYDKTGLELWNAIEDGRS